MGEQEKRIGFWERLSRAIYNVYPKTKPPGPTPKDEDDLSRMDEH